jgi:hypothetical protein
VLGTYAIRILYAGALCHDGGMRMDGISVLSATEDCGDMGVRHISIAIPAHVQDCVRTNSVEYRGRNRSNILNSTVCHGMEKREGAICRV